jgi:uncharacterized protein with ACT and thioredoxin-like domain
LEGTGVVRWVRTQDSEAGKSGCGVEFMELEDIPQFEKFLTELKSTPFIPMR